MVSARWLLLLLLCGCAHPAPALAPTGTTTASDPNLLVALGKDPNNRDVNWQLGRMAEGQGDLMRAEQYYQRAEALGQPEQEVVPAILRVLVAAQRYDEALSLCKKRLSASPLDRPTRFVAAALYQATDHPKEAERELNQLVRAEPRDAGAYLALARLYRDGYSDPVRARVMFERSLPLIHDETEAVRVRYELEELPGGAASSLPTGDQLPDASPSPETSR